MSWTEEIAAGFGDLVREVGVAAIWTDGTGVVHTTLVLFRAPGQQVLGGLQIIDDYAIEYLDADLPGLAHGDRLTVNGQQFAVKEIIPGDDPVLKVARLK